MSFLETALHRPRRLWLRRALFEIHLWAGLLLCVYVVVIALTGSVLVFRSELTRAALPHGLSAYNTGHVTPVEAIVAQFVAAYPEAKLQELQTPSEHLPAYVLTASNLQRGAFHLVADPVTGRFWPQSRTWLDWTYDLHVYLLLGHAYGMQVNAVGAAGLLLLLLSGLPLWWTGVKTWTRGLRVDLSRSWRRINFDAHSAIGFWTFLLVLWWALSGIYFGWYRQVTTAVATVSPLHGMLAPAIPVSAPGSDQRVSLSRILDAVHRESPGGRLFSISDPRLQGTAVYALVDLREPGDFSHRDILTLSTVDARVLTVWHYGQNQSAGDWFLWAMHPLHFGNLWGRAIKVVWALGGISLAVVAVSGLLMYWNRYLRHRLRT